MPVDILSILAKAAADLIVNGLKKNHGSEKSSKASIPEQQIQQAIGAHLGDIAKWSSVVLTYGMGVPQTTESVTIPLDISTMPRRFQRKDQHDDFVNDVDLLADASNYVVLGDPGAGKTTTIKRLIQVLLTSEPSKEGDKYQFPILVRLRELDSSLGLYRVLARTLGIPYEDRLEKVVEMPGGVREVIRTYVADQPIETAVPRFLNDLRCLVFLDGLDEVDKAASVVVENQIEELARMLHSSKIILTIRTGLSSRLMDTFCVYEICPLTPDQTRRIAKLWPINSDEFLHQLEALPYKDVSDRPLILTQLLFLFYRKGYLPSRAALVYKKVITLLLEDWDAQRGIKRVSRYAGFDPEQKIEFLSELAFHLLFRTKTKKFFKSELVTAYMEIHKRFKLPTNEAEMVAKELQTHSGLILVGEDDQLEFSHLSLHEFLAANHIVNIPQARQLKPYIENYPAPLAVAVSLSSKPSVWLSNLILEPDVYSGFDAERIRILLSRLILESPNYDENVLLGHTAIKLVFDFYKDKLAGDSIRAWISSSDAIMHSIGVALLNYVVEKASASDKLDFRLTARCRVLNEWDVEISPSGKFPKKLFLEIVKRFNVRPIWRDSDGLTYYAGLTDGELSFDKTID